MPFPTFYQQLPGGPVVILSGELNSLANNNLAPSLLAYDNTSGYLMAEFEFQSPVASYGASGTITGVSIWLLRCLRSGTYEDGTSGYTPARIPDVVIPLTSGSQIVTRAARIPPAVFKPLFKNDGTGVSLAASGNVVRMTPYTFQQTSG